jgi:MFS family permease
MALTSLTTFLFGAFIGRIGDRIGAKTRLWLFLGTFIQALFTMAAAIALWKSGQGSVASSRADLAWTNASAYASLGLMSASMGLQGIMGKRVNTQFATTSEWAQISLSFTHILSRCVWMRANDGSFQSRAYYGLV